MTLKIFCCYSLFPSWSGLGLISIPVHKTFKMNESKGNTGDFKNVFLSPTPALFKQPLHVTGFPTSPAQPLLFQYLQFCFVTKSV
jgi:hypothetical protein